VLSNEGEERTTQRPQGPSRVISTPVNVWAAARLCTTACEWRESGGDVGSAVRRDELADPFRHDLEALYRTSAPALARAIYAFTGGRRQIAEDAVAEAFARAIEHVADIRVPLPWIYKTAFRLATRELERERRPLPSAPDPVPGIDPSDLRDVFTALVLLTPRQRAAVLLHDEEGMTAPEVGRLLGLSAATVRVHLFRARKRLRALLGDEEVPDE
jgi:RNA polymerase sigma factor (sigma-70 family)